MPTRRFFPLFLLLLAWTVPTLVYCQEVSVRLVSTHYLEVTWDKEKQWLGVDDFLVDFTAEGSRNCSTTVTCTSVTCSFNSQLCGLVDPCTFTTTTVTGDVYTAETLSLITGPEEVTDLDIYLEEGVEYISWTNPSTNSSPCYEKTAVRVSFNGKESIAYLGPDEEDTTKPLCAKGHGKVEVFALGGNGRSFSSWGDIVYVASDVVDLVTFETCEPVGCSGLLVEWTYVPVCPDVAYLQVTMDSSVTQNLSIGADSLLNVTDLQADKEYVTCIKAMDVDGKILDSSCNYYCETADEVIENLVAKSLSSTSLRVTWEPPACPGEPPIKYKLRVDYDDHITTKTTYDVHDLKTFTEYEVEVRVDRGSYYGDTPVTTKAYTSAPEPYVYPLSVYSNYIEVRWSSYVSSYYDYDFYYTVMWGSALQHEEQTWDERYKIKGYNSTDEVYKVCVTTTPQGREDLTSSRYCRYVDDPSPSESLDPWEITGMILTVMVIVTVLVFVLYVSCKPRTHQQQQRRQQQQQRRQQQQQQHINTMYSHGPDT